MKMIREIAVSQDGKKWAWISDQAKDPFPEDWTVEEIDTELEPIKYDRFVRPQEK